MGQMSERPSWTSLHENSNSCHSYLFTLISWGFFHYTWNHIFVGYFSYCCLLHENAVSMRAVALESRLLVPHSRHHTWHSLNEWISSHTVLNTTHSNKSRALFFIFLFFWLCWVFVSVRGLSLVAASGGHSSSQCAGLSLSRPLLLRSTGSRRAGSAVVAHGPSCSLACGILPDQGSNPCPLHWQADSQPLRHQGSPRQTFNREE